MDMALNLADINDAFVSNKRADVRGYSLIPSPLLRFFSEKTFRKMYDRIAEELREGGQPYASGSNTSDLNFMIALYDKFDREAIRRVRNKALNS